MRRRTDDERAAAVADYGAGMSAEDTARRHDAAVTSVLIWVRKAGGVVRRQGRTGCQPIEAMPVADVLQ